MLGMSPTPVLTTGSPDAVSTCYRVVAQLYLLRDPLPPETEVIFVNPGLGIP